MKNTVKAERQQILRVFHLKRNSIVCIKISLLLLLLRGKSRGVRMSWSLCKWMFVIAGRVCPLLPQLWMSHSWLYGSGITKREMSQKGEFGLIYLTGPPSAPLFIVSVDKSKVFHLSSRQRSRGLDIRFDRRHKQTLIEDKERHAVISTKV